MILASTGFGVALIVCAFSPAIGLAYAAMLFVGWASVSFISIGNSTIQLSSAPSMRGRMLALWQVAFQGTTPIGGPVVGWIIALSNPRIGLAVGGAACFVAAAGGAGLAGRYRRAEARTTAQPDRAAPAEPLTDGTPADALGQRSPR
jgi:MFS family permease